MTDWQKPFAPLAMITDKGLIKADALGIASTTSTGGRFCVVLYQKQEPFAMFEFSSTAMAADVAMQILKLVQS